MDFLSAPHLSKSGLPCKHKMKTVLSLGLFLALSVAIEFQKVPFEWSSWSQCSKGKRYQERLQIQTMKEIKESWCEGNDEEDELIKAKDCAEIAYAGDEKAGKHWIWISPSNKVTVQCMDDGWTVIQSRGQFGNPKDYFLRKWDSYVAGFGEPGKEHWLGLNNIHDLTQSKKYQLRVTMRNFDQQERVAFYDTFYLKDRTLYQLQVGGYSGNAGDSLTYQGTRHVGHNFTTIDQDHDTTTSNCAILYKGAWWYDACHRSNLNGYNFGTSDRTPYAQGIVWYQFTTYYHSLQSVQMAIRPANYIDHYARSKTKKN